MDVDDLKLELPEKIASQCVDEALRIWNISNTVAKHVNSTTACLKKSKWTYSSIFRERNNQIPLESITEVYMTMNYSLVVDLK